MPIKDLQRAWREIGRIRIGDRGEHGDGTPRKLQTFRLTSGSEAAIKAAAGEYGFLEEPRPWRSPAGPAWEVTLGTAELDVTIPPGEVFSQWWERWTAAGCERRCDGEIETLAERPCVCPADLGERATEAKAGRACRPITRLAVILPHLPDLGIWRLETHSLIAARELAATMAAVEVATARGIYVPARLRLEQRRSRRPGEKPHDYGIPVLELPEMRAGRLLGGGATSSLAPEPAALLEAAPDADAGPELEELEELQAEPPRELEPRRVEAPAGPPVDAETDRAYLDPDSPDFLGPDPTLKYRAEPEPSRMATRDASEPEQPEPDPEPAPRVDHRDEPPGPDEAAALLDAIYAQAADAGRTPDEAERFLIADAELHDDPTPEDVAELLPRVPARSYQRVAYRFRAGDYTLSGLDRARRRAEIELAKAARRDRRTYQGQPDATERAPRQPSLQLGEETYTPNRPETAGTDPGQ